ncbi:MAG: replication initiation protein [Cetobacterium sp.]|uniref:replication initiation protein n=1 Tax=Cetobacterium sp. TaxID=2071632 RepID=UPI003F3F497D
MRKKFDVNLIKVHNLFSRAMVEYTLLEQKKMYEIIKQWQKEILEGTREEDDLIMELDFSYFKKISGFRTTEESKILEVLKGIVGKGIIFYEKINGVDTYFRFTPITKFGLIHDNYTNKTIKFELDKNCLNYLNINLKEEFYYRDLSTLRPVKSQNTVSMYDLLAGNKMLLITIEDLRKIFQVSEKLKNKDFVVKLKKTLEDLQVLFPEANIKYEFLKKGRFVSSLKATYSQKKLHDTKERMESSFFDIKNHIMDFMEATDNFTIGKIDFIKIYDRLVKTNNKNLFLKLAREIEEETGEMILDNDTMHEISDRDCSLNEATEKFILGVERLITENSFLVGKDFSEELLQTEIIPKRIEYLKHIGNDSLVEFWEEALNGKKVKANEEIETEITEIERLFGIKK